jgi:hypothetical protein
LGDALAQAAPDAIAASEGVIEAASADFCLAAGDARGRGETLPTASAVMVLTALARCRRLGFSLSLITGQPSTPSDAPRAYTPVGRAVAAAGGGTFLTARG